MNALCYSDHARKQIQEALNQQTYPQFKAYAEQQYRDNRQAVGRAMVPSKFIAGFASLVFQQDELIRQLQEQHFQQYIQQVYQQQLLRTVNTSVELRTRPKVSSL